jgi:hypothetical protein
MDLKEIQQNISFFNEKLESNNEFVMNNEFKSFGQIKIDKNKYSCVWPQCKYYRIKHLTQHNLIHFEERKYT